MQLLILCLMQSKGIYLLAAFFCKCFGFLDGQHSSMKQQLLIDRPCTCTVMLELCWLPQLKLQVICTASGWVRSAKLTPCAFGVALLYCPTSIQMPGLLAAHPIMTAADRIHHFVLSEIPCNMQQLNHTVNRHVCLLSRAQLIVRPVKYRMWQTTV